MVCKWDHQVSKEAILSLTVTTPVQELQQQQGFGRLWARLGPTLPYTPLYQVSHFSFVYVFIWFQVILITRFVFLGFYVIFWLSALIYYGCIKKTWISQRVFLSICKYAKDYLKYICNYLSSFLLSTLITPNCLLAKYPKLHKKYEKVPLMCHYESIKMTEHDKIFFILQNYPYPVM